jgi:hypothetical protein
MNMKAIRHGDVDLIPVTKPNSGGEQKQEYTLAYGEVTGHHHTLYPLSPGAFLTLFQDGEKRVIDVEGNFVLRHQEHDELTIPPGTYEILIEREYNPFEKMMKKVVD